MTYITEIYCQNEDCNVRQSQVTTKDYGDQPEPTAWRCPGCGQKAKVHWRRTSREHERIKVRDAIGLVNAELYAREHVKPGDLVCYPLDVLALDTLPDSWKCQAPGESHA
jgi:hypothetical protein